MRHVQLSSRALFLVTCLVLVGIKLLFEVQPQNFPLHEQASAFTWQAIVTVLALGTAGLFAEGALRLPRPGEDTKRDRLALAWATIAGIAYGLITIGLDFVDRYQHPLAPGSSVHMPLPWSIPFYVFGAIFLELLLRLGAICIAVWLISSLLLRRRHFNAVFWTVTCLVALYEILPHLLHDITQKNWIAIASTPVQPLYFSNVFEGWLLLRFGWFAPILFRLTFYAVWHILYGGLWPH